MQKGNGRHKKAMVGTKKAMVGKKGQCHKNGRLKKAAYTSRNIKATADTHTVTQASHRQPESIRHIFHFLLFPLAFFFFFSPPEILPDIRHLIYHPITGQIESIHKATTTTFSFQVKDVQRIDESVRRWSTDAVWTAGRTDGRPPGRP